MTRSRLLAAAAAAYVLGLFIGIPAERLRGPLEAMLPGIRLGPLHGHPLNGRADGAVLGELSIDGLDWSWSPLALLRGRFGLSVEIMTGPTQATMELGRTYPGQLVVEHLDGELDLAWLGTHFPARGFDASGRLVAEDVGLELDRNGWVSTAGGRLQLRDGAIRTPIALRVGAAEATLEVQDERLEVAFTIPQAEPLSGDGRLRLAADGRYNLTARLAPGESADATTRKLLQLAGPAQPDGRVHVALEGALR